MTIAEEVKKSREEELKKLEEEVKQALEKIKEVFIEVQKKYINAKELTFDSEWEDFKLIFIAENGNEKYDITGIMENQSKRTCFLKMLDENLQKEGVKIKKVSSDSLTVSILL